MNIGQATIAKYPATALEKLTYEGKFYTLTNPYGNKIPVVYISDVPHPLNEKSLLESRSVEAESSNFSLVPAGAAA